MVPIGATQRDDRWVISDFNAKWSTNMPLILELPISPMVTSKTDTDEAVGFQLSRAIGALIAPNDRNGTWWSYRLTQALSTLTPIATDWTESEKLGSSWGVLPAAIESLNAEQRYLLALAQQEIYLSNIDSKETAANRLKSLLKVG
jgi:hypothetical protein